MKSHAQVAVIGGGVVGCSVLYHLTKAGWTDVVLIERDELTSGSTWHAAGGFHTLNGDPNVAKLQGYTIGLYRRARGRSPASPAACTSPAASMLPDTPERMDWLKMAHARAPAISAWRPRCISRRRGREAASRCWTRSISSARCCDPLDGHLDPSGTTHAYAKSARIAGAEIYLHTRVTDLKPRPDGIWDVITDKGNLARRACRELRRALGARGRPHGRARAAGARHGASVSRDRGDAGGRRPSTRRRRVPHVIDFKGEIYMRQERSGMLLGTYEKACVPWRRRDAVEFRHELLPPDLDRIAPSLEVGFKHFPALRERRHQARSSTAPSPSRPTAIRWSARCRACAISGAPAPSWRASARAAASAWRCRNWMVNGDPGFDVWAHGRRALRRMGDAGLHQRQGARELFPPLPHPLPQRGAAGGAAAADDAALRSLIAQGAVMGDSWGLETPLWFAPKGVEPRGRLLPPLERHVPSGRECRARAQRRRRHRDRRTSPNTRSPGPAPRLLARMHDQPDAAQGPAHADADAERRRAS